MPTHTYESAERFILSREFFGMKLGLENITEFLASLGNPQASYPTVHIAGTNGKGSTAAMMASVLATQGYKTGLFTSPHLVTMRERVRIGRRLISRPSVTAFVDRHRRELVRRKLSFFEVLTAMALEYFHRCEVDIAVIETGLGGRLDATNVLNPILTVTTDISRDHMEILGRTLPKIAREKAGIIKPGVPHLVGLLPAPADRVIASRCEEVRAPLYRLDPSEYLTFAEQNRVDFRDNGWGLTNVRPALYGPHQLKNAALVLKGVAILRRHGLKISTRAVHQGMANARWPGRFQIIRRRNRPTLVFDVGHNAGGIAAFVASFQACFPGRKAQVLTGFVKRKEHQKMFDLLAPIADSYALVPLATKRSVELKELCDAVNWRGVPMKRYGSLATAYRNLAKTSGPDDIISILGSHYLVGEFFEKFGP